MKKMLHFRGSEGKRHRQVDENVFFYPEDNNTFFTEFSTGSWRSILEKRGRL